MLLRDDWILFPEDGEIRTVALVSSFSFKNNDLQIGNISYSKEDGNPRQVKACQRLLVTLSNTLLQM